MGIVLDKWQEELLKHEGHLVLVTPRQVGKTTIMSRKIAKFMLDHPGARIIVVSLTEDQAKLIIVMVLDFFEKFNRALLPKKKTEVTTKKIRLKNGSQVIARPVGNTGDAVRGFTGDVLVLDEASRFNEDIFTSAKPTLMSTAGKIWMCSTPFGRQGYFYKCYLNKNNRYKVMHLKDTREIIKERKGWSEEEKKIRLQELEEERKEMSDFQFRQEYCAQFIEDLLQYFPDALLNKICVLKRPTPYPKYDNYMGVDIARMGGDECAYEILHRRTDTNFIHIENITKTKQLTTQTEDDILALNTSFHLDKIGIDAGAGSLGVGIFDRLIKIPKTRSKVIPMNNRQISLDKQKKKKQRIFKEDMYDNLLAMMEKGEIRLLNDDKVFASLKSVQSEYNEETGKFRIFGNYTHIAEGLVRAAWLAKKEKSKKLFIDYI